MDQELEKCRLLTAVEVSELTSFSVKTLAKWRCQRKHLKFIKIGEKVRYKLQDVQNFISRAEACDVLF